MAAPKQKYKNILLGILAVFATILTKAMSTTPVS